MCLPGGGGELLEGQLTLSFSPENPHQTGSLSFLSSTLFSSQQMSFRSHRRRSSGTGGNLIARRSSMTQRELDQLIKARQRLPDWLLFPAMLGAPPLVLALHAHFSARYHPDQSIFDHIFVQICSPVPVVVLLLLVQLQLLFLWCLPAKNVPVTTEEGVSFDARFTSFDSSLLVCLLYVFGAVLGLYPGDLIFAHWTGLLFWLSLLSFLLIFSLHFFLPLPSSSSSSSSSFPSDDCSSSSSSLPIPSSSHSLISHLFYGLHLHPVLLQSVDLKSFLTFRLSLTLWALFLISSHFARPSSSSSSLFTTSALQLVYVFRRQWFEHLHISGLDNKNDRAGFYRIWGVLVLLPTVYLMPVTICTLSDDPHPRLPLPLCMVLFLAGLFCQYLNSAIDLQRYNFRRSNGDLKIGGKDPFYVCVRYRKECSGESGVALLLGSGYWGMARHPNYTAEFCSFLAWTLPSWGSPLVCWAPLAFLAALLWVRTSRDELRCHALYGHSWAQHCAKVPYRLFPGF